MEDHSDRILQEWLDNGAPEDMLPEVDMEEKETYELLFDTLNSKPAVRLPDHFSASVVACIQATEYQLPAFKWRPVILLLLLAGLAVFYGVASWVDIKIAVILEHMLYKFKWFFIFGTGAFLLIEYLDQQLLGKRRFGRR
ncbi:hypothetical protein [Chitinophaga nivalis]|uniref:DUF5056 domain-containing protein n=1 Tax=Chitinophaga nivalis TaxID=2991709 RepID=A0ABT3IJT8_9BACT|nr:hypothetical protein [Chitinophaga nivalis]MCW3466091.1 hypothetical protein [Chitinophaga nivalis]MCW3484218.1 hypothetical protein [Chitinophaga nivalis]